MDCRHVKRDIQRNLPLDIGLREAVANHLRRKFPTSAAKNTARHYRMSLDQARHAVNGHGSIAAIETIFMVGGWSDALPIVGAVIGQAVENYLIQQRKAHAENAARLGAIISGHWSVAADRNADPRDLSTAPVGRRGSGSNRKAQG